MSTEEVKVSRPLSPLSGWLWTCPRDPAFRFHLHPSYGAHRCPNMYSYWPQLAGRTRVDAMPPTLTRLATHLQLHRHLHVRVCATQVPAWLPSKSFAAIHAFVVRLGMDALFLLIPASSTDGLLLSSVLRPETCVPLFYHPLSFGRSQAPHDRIALHISYTS
jgi:hypothetical protein